MKYLKTPSLTGTNLTVFILFSNLLNFGFCLYEDQIGKFDWSKHYVGKVIDGFLDDRTGQLLVYTEENVLASINPDTGDINWRQVLEKNERGSFRLLQSVNDPSTEQTNVEVRRRSDDSGNILTITGGNLILGRSWNPKTGNLAFEWTATNPVQSNSEGYWFYHQSVVYGASVLWGSHIDVVAFNAKTGQQLNKASKKISINSIQKNDCDFIKSYLVCENSNQIVVFDLRSADKDILAPAAVGKRLQVIKGPEPLVTVGDKVYNLNTKQSFKAPTTGNTLLYSQKNNRKLILQASVDVQKQSINIKATNFEDGELLTFFDVNYPEHLGQSQILDGSCKKNKKSELICRVLLTTENAAIVQIQTGKITWTREESLADIAAIEMLDLPLLDNEGAIERQLKSRNGDILNSFLQRISTQLNHVNHLLQTLFDVVSTKHRETPREFTRDAFGLHTIIVILTNSGKLFGIDNNNGKHHYVKYLPNFTGFENDQTMQLIVQRTSKHFPHPAQCSIIARNKLTGNGVIYKFNPITGESINDEVIQLNYKIRQFVVLQPNAEFLKEIVLLDQNNQVHILPGGSLALVENTYIYSANKETGVLTGYHIQLQGQHLEAIETWSINLSGLDNAQKILTIAAKNPIEHVHSQGRVLNDRSVLYKYINPNLVAVVTQGLDNIYKYVLNVHLVDVVSGGIVSTITHRRVRGPVNIVHSENWLVYTYFNDKVRRTEITAIELYEGNTQTNSTVWTSFDAPPLPAVVQQSYIIPYNVLHLRETITEKGITHKHILMALSAGSIFEVPWQYLDPRRPAMGSNQAREEGILPYMPELPLSHEGVINYNQTISRLKGIYTAPSGLESTCLVVAYGLDFFVTRVAPSKTYDLLKEDFDYFLITSVLLGLSIASLIVKYMSARKLLKQAWK